MPPLDPGDQPGDDVHGDVLRQDHEPAAPATVSAIRRPATAVMFATTIGMVAPEPSGAVRSTANLEATVEKVGDQERFVVGEVVGGLMQEAHAVTLSRREAPRTRCGFPGALGQDGLMGERAERWRRSVDPHFGFLTGLGSRGRSRSERSAWSVWVQYRSASAAVRVSRSNEFIRCEVELIRLVDGSVPAYPIWITDDRIDWTLLDNVVEVRRPDLAAEAARHRGLGPAEVEDLLAYWAQVLRDVAGDFLAGDLAAIDEAGALVRSRVAEHPQQVQVWLPDERPRAPRPCDRGRPGPAFRPRSGSRSAGSGGGAVSPGSRALGTRERCAIVPDQHPN